MEIFNQTSWHLREKMHFCQVRKTSPKKGRVPEEGYLIIVSECPAQHWSPAYEAYFYHIENRNFELRLEDNQS